MAMGPSIRLRILSSPLLIRKIAVLCRVRIIARPRTEKPRCSVVLPRGQWCQPGSGLFAARVAGRLAGFGLGTLDAVIAALFGAFAARVASRLTGFGLGALNAVIATLFGAFAAGVAGWLASFGRGALNRGGIVHQLLAGSAARIAGRFAGFGLSTAGRIRVLGALSCGFSRWFAARVAGWFASLGLGVGLAAARSAPRPCTPARPTGTLTACCGLQAIRVVLVENIAAQQTGNVARNGRS